MIINILKKNTFVLICILIRGCGEESKAVGHISTSCLLVYSAAPSGKMTLGKMSYDFNVLVS